MKLTKSVEDYLEAIYIISSKKRVVRVKELADFLDISPASVSESLNRISEAQLIFKEKYGYVHLTNRGKVLAKNIYGKHKILLYFFEDILNVDAKIALKEACEVEHCLSDTTISKLKKHIQKIDIRK